MKRQSILVLAMFLVCFAAHFTRADMVRGIDIDFVTVGNAGNPADTTGYGAVDYEFSIGKYEVTNAQWNTFTAAAGSPTGNPSFAYDQSNTFTSDQQPTKYVSWYEAAQFCNYLTSGNKSLGVYQFSGDNANPGNFIDIDRVMAKAIYGSIYFLPTQDEWYKAAYHKNDGVTGNYWLYPTQSNTPPSNALINPDPGNNANFYQNGYTIVYPDLSLGYPDFLTDVGEFENSYSAYGTFDQAGNVWEWNETLIGSERVIRGAGYGDGIGNLISSDYSASLPLTEDMRTGFRVAQEGVVPVPSAVILGSLGLTFSGWLLKRKRMI